ncbi:hypothetical protein DFH06DRAFT_1348819 [Mycena polygramma]|nr:hypothetical protein DFH06DRAFT_1348819 [Mycena polygramma]
MAKCGHQDKFGKNSGFVDENGGGFGSAIVHPKQNDRRRVQHSPKREEVAFSSGFDQYPLLCSQNTQQPSPFLTILPPLTLTDMKRFLRSSTTTSALLRPSSPPVEQPPSKRARNGESPVSTEAETAARAKDFAREVTRAVGVAKQPENVVPFPHFNFERGAAGKKQLGGKKLVIPPVEWMDDTPRIGISNDNIPVVVHLPGIIKPRSTAHTFKELMDFVQDGLGGKLQKCGGADGQKEAASSYKDVVGQLAGIFKLVKIWHPVGHPHANPTIARDMIKSGRTFAASLSLIEQMRFISARVNAMLQAVDPVNFAQLQSLRTEAERINYFLQILNKADPLVMEGREIMWNRQTGLHKDGSDPARSWAVLVVFGPFTGGALSIPCLGLRMRYTDGTMIMAR